MRVGIYTHYAHCDEAYFAIRLADLLKSQHVDFTIYSDCAPARLHSAYDNIVWHKAMRNYTGWLKDVSSVVWTHVPKTEQVNCASNKGVGTVIVPMWQDLMQPFRKAIRAADHVVALTTECRELFKTVYKFKHATMIPFDTGLPIIKKLSNIDEKRVKIFLPWFDRNARCAHGDLLGQLGWLMERMPEATLTVAISSSRFSPAVAKFFQRLGARTDGRVSLRRNVLFDDRPALYTAHDITLLPAECDNYGLCSLTSVTCGTPVLSFDVSPQSDFIKSDTNGFLVKTTVNYDENGVPHADPDYEKLLASLQSVVAEPWHITALNKRTAYNLDSRRKAFTLGWQTLLRLV